ncbi:DUF5700 domain-containing putative Zn-dependent protease [Brevibacillus sp. GCM10020057]|uniref:DUF5700 domain-containing putative Zn-dependent protease n=1 Tax=Brevibacillus sp. GCM10020057 TaxID=3317327 RepID=UPI003645BD6B
MIHLSVEIDSSLVEWLKLTNNPQVDFPNRFLSFQQENNLQLPNASLVDFPISIDMNDIKSMMMQIDKLKTHLTESVVKASSFFPDTSEEYYHHLKVILLPFGKINYGPTEGVQIFSLFPHTDWRETILFLTHVYYHEITHLNYTKRCKEVSANHKSKDSYLYYLQVLIQNEGIANYIVLEELEKMIPLLGNKYIFRYFTYARNIRSEELITKCMDVFNQLFMMEQETFNKYYKKIARLIKSEELPAINLIGIYLATVIAENYGIDVLRNVHQKPATEFFSLYMETDDPLRNHLKDVSLI